MGFLNWFKKKTPEPDPQPAAKPPPEQPPPPAAPAPGAGTTRAAEPAPRSDAASSSPGDAAAHAAAAKADHPSPEPTQSPPAAAAAPPAKPAVDPASLAGLAAWADDDEGLAGQSIATPAAPPVSPPSPTPQSPGAVEPTPKSVPAQAGTTAPQPAAVDRGGPTAAPPAAARKSLLGRFLDGLNKTRRRLVDGLLAVLPFGRRIDEEILEGLYEQLISADLGVDATKNLLAEIRAARDSGEIETAEQILPFLRRRLIAVWPEDDTQLNLPSSGVAVILIVGVNGSGKTTSIAKLASYLAGQGRRVMVAACDTFRAGAVNQLAIWAERAGVDIIRQAQGSDPAAVAYDACEAAVARGADVLIVDTAGRLHTQDHLMRELEKLHRVIAKKIPNAPHETLLVLDSTTGQNALQQARMFSAATKVTGLFLTKLDGSAKGGVVIAIRNEVDVPVKFVGLGESMADIAVFDARRYVEGLLGSESEEPVPA